VDPAAGLARDAVAAGELEVQAPGSFEVLAQDPDSPARAGRLWTAHGPMDTPCFMPVGTYGAVKGLIAPELKAIGSQTILANAYHLGHRPGSEVVEEWGGVHGLMHWDGPILTDSGGYQVFSLRSLQKIRDDGVRYRTHFDGSYHVMTPRSVLEGQAHLGSDICMILDHCPPGDADDQLRFEAVQRSTKWAREASDMRREVLREGQLCFGICQGGTDFKLRKHHLAELAEMDFDGLALGGLSVGEPVPAMHATFAEIAPLMPANKPRYVMGIGTPIDLLMAVSSGVDMFDCVIPTRHARNAQFFTFFGKINIRKSRFRTDPEPVDPHCGCFCCQTYSRRELRHLHVHNDPLYVRLATIHNLFFFHQWVATMRIALREGRFGELKGMLTTILEDAKKGS
jgi:queuine tRNA-ribosyltransferase